MAETLTLLDNLKALHDQIPDDKKGGYYLAVHEEYNIAFRTVTTTWFSAWRIPNKYKMHEQLVTFTQNFIKNLKTSKNETN